MNKWLIVALVLVSSQAWADKTKTITTTVETEVVDENIVEEKLVAALIAKEKVDKPTPFTVQGIVGGLVSQASRANTKILPFLEIQVDAPTANSSKAPRLITTGQASSLPGESINLKDLTTFRALSLDVMLLQPILPDKLYFAPFLELGFTTRLNGDTEPRDSTARYIMVGLRFAPKNRRGWLAIGIGGSQEMPGSGQTYQAAVRLTSALKIWSEAKTKDLKGVKMVVKVSGILGIDPYGTGRLNDVVLTSLAVGF